MVPASLRRPPFEPRVQKLKTYTVCTRDGEFIATVSREERNRLRGCNEDGRAPRYDHEGYPVYNEPLVEAHRKLSRLYFALVDASIIRAELRRELSNRIPIAEDNRTVREVEYSNENGAGRYFEHNQYRSSLFPVSREFLRDEILRKDTRPQRTATLKLRHGIRRPVRPPLNKAAVMLKKAAVIEFPPRIETLPLPEAA